MFTEYEDSIPNNMKVMIHSGLSFSDELRAQQQSLGTGKLKKIQHETALTSAAGNFDKVTVEQRVFERSMHKNSLGDKGSLSVWHSRLRTPGTGSVGMPSFRDTDGCMAPLESLGDLIRFCDPDGKVQGKLLEKTVMRLVKLSSDALPSLPQCDQSEAYEPYRVGLAVFGSAQRMGSRTLDEWGEKIFNQWDMSTGRDCDRTLLMVFDMNEGQGRLIGESWS